MLVRPGSLLNAVFMIAGLCIGGAMVGLPAILADLGFLASIAVLLFAWVFMSYTALLTYEVNCAYPMGCHFLTMAAETLGPIGKYITSGSYVLLLYALLAAYLTGSSNMVQQLFVSVGISGSYKAISWGMLTLMVALVSAGTAFVAKFNRLLMLVLVAVYFVMVFTFAPHVHIPVMQAPQWGSIPLMLVVVLTSFGFHILIPSVRGYLQDDHRMMVRAMILGGLLACVVYSIWVFVINGSLPLATLLGIREGTLQTSAMFSSIASSWLALAGSGFIVLALLTSFVGVLLSLLDFFADSLGVAKQGKGLVLLLAVSLVPPLLFVFFYPHAFILALSYAGIMVAFLHGALPALMVLSVRARGIDTPYRAPVPIWLVYFILLVSLALILSELLMKLSA
jgi:tyrosine-specific transport protein